MEASLSAVAGSALQKAGGPALGPPASNLLLQKLLYGLLHLRHVHGLGQVGIHSALS